MIRKGEKNMHLDMDLALDLVNGIFNWFNYIGNPDNPCEKEKIEEYFTENIVVESNGKVVANGHEGLKRWVERVQEKVQEMRFPQYEDLVVGENKIALRFVSEVTHSSGVENEVFFIAIWHVKNGKIDKCFEVSHDLEGSQFPNYDV